MINRIKERFTQVSNTVLDNPQISIKAKGLYAYLCSKPDSWQFSYEGLTSQLAEGTKAIRSAIKELVDHNVLIRIPKYNDKHLFGGWEWIINPTDEDLQRFVDPAKSSQVIANAANQRNRNYQQTELPKKGISDNGYYNNNTNISNTDISNTITKIKEKINQKEKKENPNSQLFDDIRNKGEWYKSHTLSDQKLLDDFWFYWTETDQRGKARWQKQETFEIERRFITWKRKSEEKKDYGVRDYNRTKTIII